jgi:hypothetical protein
MDQVPMESLGNIHQSILAASIGYFAAAMFVKLSLCAFYLRLSVDERFRMAVYVIATICIAYGIASILTSAFLCIPLSKLWNPNEDGHCINAELFYFVNAGLNVATDTIIYILPMRPLWKLPLPRRQRIGLLFLFALGAL